MNAKIKIAGLAVALLFIFSACSNDDDERIYRDIGTVENPRGLNTFMLLTDKDVSLSVETSSYRPKNGVRLIADFVIIEENPARASFAAETIEWDYHVKLTNIYEILTKGIFEITPETQDSIGNDPVKITNMWMTRDFLNFEFYIPVNHRKHYINLVSDASKTYDDNKIHLEFRHNSNNDFSSSMSWGIVSFNMESLKLNAAADSVNIVIHSREFSSPEEKTREITYKFNQTQAAQTVPKIMKGAMVEFE